MADRPQGWDTWSKDKQWGYLRGLAAGRVDSPAVDALKRICQYESPAKIRRNAAKDYGLGADEAIEMAYENILIEAKAGLRKIRSRHD